MTTTIEAMKLALLALDPLEANAVGVHPEWADERQRATLKHGRPISLGDCRQGAAAAYALRGAIAAEEAQGVEPCLRFIRHGEPGTSSETISVVAIAALPKDGALLFTRPAPPPADHIGEATTMAGKRAALAKRLRGLADAARLLGAGCAPRLTCEDIDAIADMLTADALSECAGHGSPAELQRHNDYMAGFNEATKRAQQVAVPQEPTHYADSTGLLYTANRAEFLGLDKECLMALYKHAAPQSPQVDAPLKN